MFIICILIGNYAFSVLLFFPVFSFLLSRLLSMKSNCWCHLNLVELKFYLKWKYSEAIVENIKLNWARKNKKKIHKIIKSISTGYLTGRSSVKSNRMKRAAHKKRRSYLFTSSHRYLIEISNLDVSSAVFDVQEFESIHKRTKKIKIRSNNNNSKKQTATKLRR